MARIMELVEAVTVYYSEQCDVHSVPVTWFAPGLVDVEIYPEVEPYCQELV